MEVEEAKPHVIKRKAEICEERETDDFFLNFYEHFKVPTDAWLVIGKCDDTDILYRHRESNRLLLISKLIDRKSNSTVGYDLYFRQNEDKDVVPLRCLISNQATEDDKTGIVLYNLAQIDEQYALEPIVNANDVTTYYNEFLALLGMNPIVNETNEAVSFKRRKEQK